MPTASTRRPCKMWSTTSMTSEKSLYVLASAQWNAITDCVVQTQAWRIIEIDVGIQTDLDYGSGRCFAGQAAALAAGNFDEGHRRRWRTGQTAMSSQCHKALKILFSTRSGSGAAMRVVIISSTTSNDTYMQCCWYRFFTRLAATYRLFRSSSAPSRSN